MKRPKKPKGQPAAESENCVVGQGLFAVRGQKPDRNCAFCSVATGERRTVC
jgi:lipoate synthase